MVLALFSVWQSSTLDTSMAARRPRSRHGNDNTASAEVKSTYKNQPPKKTMHIATETVVMMLLVVVLMPMLW